MEIRISELKKMLQNFDDNDIIHLGYTYKATIDITKVQKGIAQIQVTKNKNTKEITYEIISF